MTTVKSDLAKTDNLDADQAYLLTIVNMNIYPRTTKRLKILSRLTHNNRNFLKIKVKPLKVVSKYVSMNFLLTWP